MPLVLAHRGACGHRPENTLAAHELAARMGADYLEVDLVATKDGALVARHENELSRTTDVAARPEFAGRRATKAIDGTAVTGWFSEDFTLAEIRTLRARERSPALRPGNTRYDHRFGVPALGDLIELRARLSRELRREIGLCLETKHSTYFRSVGLPLEEPLVSALRTGGLDQTGAPVIVQSFETANLRALRAQAGIRLVQLYGAREKRPWDHAVAKDPRTYAQLATPLGLRSVAAYAHGVAPPKDYVVPRDGAGRSLAPTRFVDDAHAAGLAVHPYTFRDSIAEHERFCALGVDALISDNPDTAVEARGRSAVPALRAA